MTEVVAALIWQGEKFLICQRPAQKARGLLWEFVGGKVERGETPRQALMRECREELGIEMIANEEFCEVTHEYPDLTVHLTLFSARILGGEPQLLEHADMRWITAEEISAYDFCPADAEILQKIRERDALLKRVRRSLFAMQDVQYREFHKKLMPTVAEERVIGVRVPALRAFAKEFARTQDAADFLQILSHDFYEEENLHAFLLEKIPDFDEAMEETERFLPYLDNWATCDMMNPRAFQKQPEKLLEKVRLWITSEHPYTIRYGIGMLMRYFLEERFTPEYPALVAGVKSGEYYVNMMIAWYFATALAKQYDAVIPYLEERRLEKWVHNKAIQKAIESRRISPEQKQYLRTLKV